MGVRWAVSRRGGTSKSVRGCSACSAGAVLHLLLLLVTGRNLDGNLESGRGNANLTLPNWRLHLFTIHSARAR